VRLQTLEKAFLHSLLPFTGHDKTVQMKKAVTKKKSLSKKEVKEKLPVKDDSKNYTFFEDVWGVVRQIPKGRVTSYGAIANYLGTKLSARMVGWAMKAAHYAHPRVPAQRVVNRNGMLTGKHLYETPTRMQELLEKDGVKVEKSTVINFEKRFWDPVKELGF
jgi:methylated-DNA-protein-cysteine methyltransferase-like protein